MPSFMQHRAKKGFMKTWLAIFSDKFIKSSGHYANRKATLRKFPRVSFKKDVLTCRNKNNFMPLKVQEKHDNSA